MYSNVVPNLVVLGILSIPYIYLSFFGVPVERGFFCDDESLSHPYHDSTIPTYALYITGFGFPLVVVLITEAILEKRNNGVIILTPYLKSVFKVLIDFGFGAATSQCLTDIAKYSIGRLRPHFFDVCRPIFENLDCGPRSYVLNYTCQGNLDLFHTEEEAQSKIEDAHLSFVSGHASFSCQAATFIILYLYAKSRGVRRSLIIPFIQLSFGLFAYYTSLSRVTDFKHHPTDVIAGAVFGITAQTINVIYVTDLLERRRSSSKEALVESLAMGNESNTTEANRGS
ncbi:phospholipid phosphatase 1 isoform X2 [Lepeophtheirus salmonis]|nr:phospholipid phosphatase 1-like isoform X2 [Lepeophtheirus salmonis]XP_040577036.1 phospholipid phosphatase 1-like isoform X2 [Lepeophtheirus salmonis]